MILYHISVTELDAHKLQAPRQDDETEGEYEQRLRESKGKHFFRVLVQDGESQQFSVASPFFDKDSEQQKWTTLDQGFKQIKKAIVARERMKENQPKQEASALIINGVEQELRRLENRKKN